MRSTGACIAAVAVVLAAAAPTVARADAVTYWNGIGATAIVSGAGQVPHQATLSFAMVQGAVFDAVNAIDGRHRPYLAAPPANPWDSKEASAATAAYKVLVGLFPGQLATLQPLYDTYNAAQRLGASEAGANNLYPYALAWHWRQTELLSWYRDPACRVPPWIPPAP